MLAGSKFDFGIETGRDDRLVWLLERVQENLQSVGK